MEAGRQQYRAFLVIALAAVATTVLAQRVGVTAFARFLGPVPPSLAAALAAVLGVLLLPVLASSGGFAIRRVSDLRGPLRAAGLAAVFGAVIVAADLVIVFPPDLNAPFPDSLLFYPPIAFVAEIGFHVLPLALLLAPAPSPPGTKWREAYTRAAVIVVALLEPTFQALVGGSPPHAPGWVAPFVWCHIAAINLTQLLIFQRHDFVSMLSFRITYYLLWHVAWGHLRLRILF